MLLLSRRLLASLFCLLVVLALAVPALASPAVGPASFDKASMPLDMVERRVMPKVHSAALAADAERMERDQRGVPFRFAEPLEVDMGTDDSGTWETLADGSRLWRLRLVSPGAVNLNVGFSRFRLPAGARLWIYDPVGELVQGPFDADDRSRRGRLYTPIVRGEEIVLELHVPAGGGEVDVRLESLNQGFRGFESLEKAGSCNNDVICPEGDGWRDQIRSVARYSIDGTFLCTGQLVNNTAQDDTPYFLSAFHCDVSAANDDTVVVYWNFESPVCGQQGGGSLDQNQTGSTYRAGDAVGDFLLVELDEMPDPAYDVFFTGWDVSGQTPQGSVGIHHPSGDEKSISFNTDALTSVGWDPFSFTIDPSGVDHWMVDDWENGTTEQGSSGSCIWDPINQLCVGVLTAGLASCDVIDFDIYGKLWYAWDSAGDTPEKRLRDWLDPLGLGVATLQGKDPGEVEPPTCLPTETNLCLNNDRFRVEVEWADFDGNRGSGQVVPASSDDSGLFWFFNPDNWEMLVKVLDGCGVTGHFWVFSAATTNVEYTLTVTDTATDTVKTYFNPLGTAAAAVTDTAAFQAPCGPSSTPPPERDAVVRLDAPAPGVTVRALEAGGSPARAAASKVRLGPLDASVGGKQLDGLRPKACVLQFIDCNSTAQGTLDTSDCDFFGDGTFSDFFAFDGAAGQEVEINLTSNDFDPYLQLVNPSDVSVVDDNDSGSGTNARIVHTLDTTGEWGIVANNFSPVTGDPGDFTLSLACNDVQTGPPAAPTNLVADTVSDTEIDIFWDDNSNNEEDFEVQIRESGGTFVSIGAVGANAIGAGVSGLDPETTYDFRVRARNPSGNSAFSNVATATTDPAPVTGPCLPDDTTLCLEGGRFRVQVDWGDFVNNSGPGQVVPFGSDDSGIFWFFDANNWEMLTKIVDGCDFNDHFWIFGAAVTNVEYTLRVTDTQTGAFKSYFNPLGTAAPAITDTVAFATCP